MLENKENQEKRHLIELENRKNLIVDGVETVEAFDSEKILLKTTLGNLLICGNDLHIKELMLEKEKIAIVGNVDSLAFVEYQDKKEMKAKGKRFLSKITG